MQATRPAGQVAYHYAGGGTEDLLQVGGGGIALTDRKPSLSRWRAGARRDVLVAVAEYRAQAVAADVWLAGGAPAPPGRRG